MINITKEAHKRGLTLREVACEVGYSLTHLATARKNKHGSIYFWESIYSFFGLELPLNDVFNLGKFKNNKLRQLMYMKKLSIEQVAQLSGFSVRTVMAVLGNYKCVSNIAKEIIQGVINNA